MESRGGPTAGSSGNRGYARPVEGGISEEDRILGSWWAAMRGALVATVAHPAWWAVALAAFLVRGGIILAILPIVQLPSTAGLITAFAPPLEALVLGRPSLEGVAVGTLLIGLVLAGLAIAGMTGAWLDLALVREATDDDELDLGWSPQRASAWTALGIRLMAHAPTFLALAYGSARIIGATYDELIAPGDLTVPVAIRVALRAPDAVALIGLSWLLGEALGPLAARRVATGEPPGLALRLALRQVLGGRGIATTIVANLPVAIVSIPFLVAVGSSWEHLRTYLDQGVGVVNLAAALLLLIASWILGMALLAAALTWRATAWTVQVVPRPAGLADPVSLPVSEPAAEGTSG